MRSSAHTRGFTLIELLVVISVIGMLASIIFAAVTSARDRARLSSGLSFESGIYQNFGATAVAIFDFSESSGTTVNDSSGNHIVATLNRSLQSTDVPPGYASNTHSLVFSHSSSDMMSLTNPASITISNTHSTITLWVKTTMSGVDTNRPILGASDWSTALRLYPDRWQVSCAAVCYSGTNSYPLYFNSPINDGKWHNLAITINNQTVSVYVDSRLDQSVTLPVSVSSMPAVALSVGAGCSGTCPPVTYADTSIAGLHIYNESFK